MRCHTTKQPSGAAMTASARPATSARRKKGSSTFGFSGRRLRRLRLAGDVVAMVMVMAVDGELARFLRTKQANVGWMLRHGLGHTRAAHVAIETNDTVAARHDDVEIV